MNINELMCNIKDILSKEQSIEQEKTNIMEKKNQAVWLLSRSCKFSERIINVIAELLSRKENTTYIPFVYEKVERKIPKYNLDRHSYYVAITKYEDFPTYTESEIIDQLISEGKIYNLFLLDTETCKHEKTEQENFVDAYHSGDYTGEPIVFSKLIAALKILCDVPIEEYYTTERIVDCIFENHEYVQDFIVYLLKLQVQNNGKPLNYEEMQKALNKFLELGSQKEVKTFKVKVRKIKKPNNKES